MTGHMLMNACLCFGFFYCPLDGGFMKVMSEEITRFWIFIGSGSRKNSLPGPLSVRIRILSFKGPWKFYIAAAGLKVLFVLLFCIY